MILFVYGLDGDESVVVYSGSDETAVAPEEAVKTLVGNNNRYYAFPNYDGFPAGWTDAPVANFDGAPRCSNKSDENKVAIDAMFASPPVDKLVG